MTVFALIPARGGSKGLPGKNIYPIAGKPLISYSIDAARGDSGIDEVWVSTDSDDIAAVGTACGAEHVMRPASLAGDLSPTSDAVFHFIDARGLTDEDIIVLLQPTSPLRNAEDIKQSLSVFLSSDAKLLLSVQEPEHTPLKAFILNDDGYLQGAFSASAPFTPRQSLPTAYLPNGAIYIFRVRDFKQSDGFPQERISPWVMSAESSVDIDSIEDVYRVEKLLESRK